MLSPVNSAAEYPNASIRAPVDKTLPIVKGYTLLLHSVLLCTYTYNTIRCRAEVRRLNGRLARN